MTSSRFDCRHFRRLAPDLAISFWIKERGPSLRWSPSTVRALPGMCPDRSCGCGPWGTAYREDLHVVGALGVLRDVETFTLGFDVDAQTNDHVDHLVEDRRPDARPHQRGADAPEL